MASALDHEKLKVYQKTLQFISEVETLRSEIPKGHTAAIHLERAATSIAPNIAEGNGKYTAADRCRFFDIARGSATECAAALDILNAKAVLSKKTTIPAKARLSEIVAMLVGLIRSQNSGRTHEAPQPYNAKD